jgi:hypothetical protein
VTISLLDQVRAFDQKFSHSAHSHSSQSTSSKEYESPSASLNASMSLNAASGGSDSRRSTSSTKEATPSVKQTSPSSQQLSNVPVSLLSSYGIVHDEWTETSYIGMNILVNALSSRNIDICAQASAKLNTILHNRSVHSIEEACYLIASVESVMCDRLNEDDDQHYAFLIPIMKSLIDKCYDLLQMNVQVPNIPFTNISPTFYEDFKSYCKTDEWRIFIQKQVAPLKEQYLAMTINPCQMNMKIWWNICFETLMVAIHKRNRMFGECKIKFEVG